MARTDAPRDASQSRYIQLCFPLVVTQLTAGQVTDRRPSGRPSSSMKQGPESVQVSMLPAAEEWQRENSAETDTDVRPKARRIPPSGPLQCKDCEYMIGLRSGGGSCACSPALLRALSCPPPLNH
ncbi:hypothetical protein D4764_08G0001260 [Takifugu flavidus]|uniref:Uncharacterized protein n=1 Tax=Takifugu flavidus TaxID=433684 RepID=A0A5C6MMZ3_9TELE|nr:hypothetical protein D4764_08G0001260 [Takifugu flavidus]